MCYTCNERWSPSHVYMNKETNVIIVSDGEESDTEEKIKVEPEGGEEEEENLNVDISLSSIVGFTNPKTMKL